MRKCEYCGREGSVPDVRGAKSAAVSIGNYRASACIDVTMCSDCADRIMGESLDELLARLEEVMAHGER